LTIYHVAGGEFKSPTERGMRYCPTTSTSSQLERKDMDVSEHERQFVLHFNAN